MPYGRTQQADLVRTAGPSTTFHDTLRRLGGQKPPRTPPTLPLGSDVIVWSERILKDCHKQLVASHPKTVKLATMKNASKGE